MGALPPSAPHSRLNLCRSPSKSTILPDHLFPIRSSSRPGHGLGRTTTSAASSGSVTEPARRRVPPASTLAYRVDSWKGKGSPRSRRLSGVDPVVRQTACGSKGLSSRSGQRAMDGLARDGGERASWGRCESWVKEREARQQGCPVHATGHACCHAVVVTL